jgi:hypothetical protein
MHLTQLLKFGPLQSRHDEWQITQLLFVKLSLYPLIVSQLVHISGDWAQVTQLELHGSHVKLGGELVDIDK